MTKKQGACGIVCEWNPLHAGHIRLIERAKTEYSAVVAAMSGPFVQRGLPAVTEVREHCWQVAIFWLSVCPEWSVCAWFPPCHIKTAVFC